MPEQRYKVNDRVRINERFPNEYWVGEEATVVEAPGWEIYYVRPDKMGSGEAGFKCYGEELEDLYD